MNAQVKSLGRSKTEREIKVITLSAGTSSAEIWTHGGRLHKLEIQVGKKLQSIVVSPSDPVSKPSFAGASVGRVANIIKRAQFEFQGKKYSLEDNFNGDHIHGGTRGFHSRNWEVADIRPDQAMVRLYTRISTEEDSYPGMLEVTLTYRLEENALHTEFRAQSSHNTLFAPTLHPFFNLSGARNINDHKLTIPLQYFQKLEDGVPKGRPVAVKGWNDLTKGSKLESILTGPRTDILNLCWIRDGLPSTEHLCSLSAGNGVNLHIHSSMPALQVYTSNTMKEDGLRAFSGIALEPEYPPDSANRVMKNRIGLFAGDARMERIIYKWDIAK
ncbi:aldose epimerase family protein [Phaeocystidibacter luteus]|uniref:Galactose mutarotase n=1 Tax=Phaeocystidibacter luteus TaxID=911197 RepID=A0A6N6RM75_9FLAO|nr:hypothetical protein [Phaeocystidibacter luteus]KAB2814714.1 hypothetical protein F8C67_02925 [Phaeocystidibacter luteus]